MDKRRISGDVPKGRSCYLFNKPDGVLTQFRASDGRRTLSDFGPFPSDLRAVGRLDAESEGLLLLTNDGVLLQRLIHPRFGHTRTYLVQVERAPDGGALSLLRTGVAIDGEATLPAEARLLDAEPTIWPKQTPVRFRKTVPTAWIELTIREGRNRQVRRMTAAVGHPALRVIRTALGPLRLEGLPPGAFRKLTGAEVASLASTVGLHATAGRDRRTGAGPNRRTGAGPNRRTGAGPNRRTGAGRDGRTGAGRSGPSPPARLRGRRTGGRSPGGAS